MSRGDNGRGACSSCELPMEVARLTSKVLVTERDVTNVAAQLRETALRLDQAVGLLGKHVCELGAQLARIEKATGGSQRCGTRTRRPR